MQNQIYVREFVALIEKHGKVTAEKMFKNAMEIFPMDWTNFWHILEQKIYEKFEVDLSEIDDEIFNVYAYYKDVQNETKDVQMHKIKDALEDFECFMDEFGLNKMVYVMSDE